MKKMTIFALALVCLALVLLIFGTLINQYKVYDIPAPEDQDKLSTFTTMTEPRLLEEMCYDGITSDDQGNLINKPREAACST